MLDTSLFVASHTCSRQTECHVIDHGDTPEQARWMCVRRHKYANQPQRQIQRNRDLAAMIYPGKKAPKYAQASMEAELCGKWIVSSAYGRRYSSSSNSSPQVLQTLMKEWREDPLNKVLIFTKSIKLLNVLEFHLKNHGVSLSPSGPDESLTATRGYGLLRLDGSTKQSERA